MSTLKTHNLQSPDAGSVNIIMAPNAGMVVAGISTFNNKILLGTSDAGYPNYADNLTVSGTGNEGITIRSGATSQGAIYFSDTTGTAAGTYVGNIIYDHSDNHMRFATGELERLRIYSNGRILIGNGGSEQSPQGNLDIVGDTNSNGPELYLRVSNNNTTDNIGALLFGNNVDKSVCMVRGSTHTANNTGDIEFHTSTTGTMSEKLRITSSGILVTGAQTTPNSTDVGSIFLKGGADLGWLTSSGSITFNAYYNGGWKYVTSGTSHILWASSEGFNFSTASSGSANGAISYSRAMKIFTNNRISIGDGNSGTPLAALHIDTKSTMGTDTALWIGSNSDNRYMTINQVSNSEQFSHMDLVFNDNGSRSMINLKNPYGPAGYGSAITWKGYNNGDQGYIECKSEGANNANATMYLNTSSGTFLQGNSSRHVTMPQQPSFAASRSGGNVGNGTVIVFNSVKFNIGSHYNNSNGRFTAPTAGKYQFSFGGMAYGTPGDFQIRIQKNGSNYFNNNGSGSGDATFEPYGFTVLMDMVVGDYANCYVYSSTSAVLYATGTTWNIFSGHLVS
nr:hypothetical protein [uncultured Mediterranean phage uvMED]